MKNKSILKMKKEYKNDWKNRRKWHRNNRAQEFQALGNHRERLRNCATTLIYDKKENDEIMWNDKYSSKINYISY